MDHFYEQLTSSRSEYEDRIIDRFRGQITLTSLVNRDPVGVSIINEPIKLVREELPRYGSVGSLE